MINKNFIAVFATILSMILVMSAVSAVSAIVSTDKLDYEPGEIVLISGEGFSANSQLTISITRPDSTIESCSSSDCNARFLDGPLTSDGSGSFSNYRYNLNGIVGTYLVYVTDGVNNAQITFTDDYNLQVEQPNGGEVWSGTHNIEWYYYYGNLDTFQYKIYYKAGNCGGDISGWTLIATVNKNTKTMTYSWDTTTIQNGDYCIGIRKTSGLYKDDKSAGTFTINNIVAPVCGNQIVESGETCDGNSQSCTTTTGYSGTQSCNTGCNGWETCTSELYCGDGTVNGNEACEDDSDCSAGQICNACVCETAPECTQDSDCPKDYTGENYCDEGDVYYENYDYFCGAAQTCSLTQSSVLVEECSYGCTAGVCDEAPQEELPHCSIDYLRVIGTSTTYNIAANPFVNSTGSFFVYGSAYANKGCYVDYVGYNRTSPNLIYWSWRSSDNQGFWETWRTWQDDGAFVEGNHEVCCKVESRECNTVGCDAFWNTNCSTFCIDTQKPYAYGITDDTQDCDGTSTKYWNSDTISWSWTGGDNGCAGIDYYQIKLMEVGNPTPVCTDESSDDSWSNSECDKKLENGKTYYIYVTPFDKAGNYMEPAARSDNVIIDLVAPVVTITSPIDGNWYNGNSILSLAETDVDTNILSCWANTDQYSGNISAVCNGAISFYPNMYCAAEGACGITKSALDKACNLGTDDITIYLDRLPPETTKNPRGNYYTNGSLMNYLQYTIHYFLGLTSGLDFSGTDSGSGCNTTYVSVMNSVGQTTSYTFDGCSGNVVMVNETQFPDGVYFVQYYSVDNVGNVELTQTETDKVDTESPLTSKTYSLFVYGWREIPLFNNLEVWMRFIRPDTTITLNAVDTEVGVSNTYYQILVPSSEGSHQEWYGDITQKWYENYEACDLENNPQTDGLLQLFVIEEENCHLTNWAVNKSMVTTDYCNERQWEPRGTDNYPAGYWCNYEGPITVEESEHKICYFSVDLLGNVEDVKCQVFSVDGIGPVTFIINPDERYIDGNLRDACVMPLDVSLEDEKVGVQSANFTLSNDSGIVKSGNLAKYIVLGSGEERWYYPNSVDLTGLAAGEYTLSVYAYDKLGNEEVQTSTITLDEGLFIPANWIKGCNVGVGGGTCTLQFTACARGVTDMDFAMTKIFDKEGGIELASLGDLNPRLVTPVDSGLVGFLNPTTAAPGYAGEITSLAYLEECEVINDRVKFNVTLNFTPELIQNIGTGTYYFDWKTNGYSEESCSQA